MNNIQHSDTNPHNLSNQVVGLIISSIIWLFFFVGFSIIRHKMFAFSSIIGNILVILTGIFTFVDAWKSGIYKQLYTRSLTNNSPMTWGIFMQWLLIIAYPVYLMNRRKLKTKEGGSLFFILVIVLGAITIAIAFLSWVRL